MAVVFSKFEQNRENDENNKNDYKNEDEKLEVKYFIRLFSVIMSIIKKKGNELKYLNIFGHVIDGVKYSEKSFNKSESLFALSYDGSKFIILSKQDNKKKSYTNDTSCQLILADLLSLCDAPQNKNINKNINNDYYLMMANSLIKTSIRSVKKKSHEIKNHQTF